MTPEQADTYAPSTHMPWGTWALIGQGLLLLAACGGDAPPNLGAQLPPVTTAPTAPATGGHAAPVPASGGSPGVAGTAPTAPTSPVMGGTKPPPVSNGGAAAVAGQAGTGPAAGGGGVAGAGSSGTSAAGSAGGPAVPVGNDGPSESSCLDGITDFGSDGPFEFTAETAGAVKMWVPKVPAGCKVPIIHLANGTGASCSNYGGSLKRMASHGFISSCYENTNTGAGTQGITAFEAVYEKHADIAAKRLGSTGHSQGGQAAFTVLSLAEGKFGDEYIYAGLAMQPASGFGTQPTGGWQASYAKIKSPMFMFSGTADVLVSESWVAQAFAALNDTVEAYNWSAIGATHIPTPDPQEMEISIPWFRWKLLGDKAACEFFKKMPQGGKWKSVKEQNVKGCE